MVSSYYAKKTNFLLFIFNSCEVSKKWESLLLGLRNITGTNLVCFALRLHLLWAATIDSLVRWKWYLTSVFSNGVKELSQNQHTAAFPNIFSALFDPIESFLFLLKLTEQIVLFSKFVLFSTKHSTLLRPKRFCYSLINKLGKSGFI